MIVGQNLKQGTERKWKENHLGHALTHQQTPGNLSFCTGLLHINMNEKKKIAIDVDLH